MEPSRIQDLATTIAANADKFDQCLKSHNLSASFETSAFTMLPESEELQASQSAMLEAISELQALVLGPITMLRAMVLKYIDLISLQIIYRFGIAQSFVEKATYKQISDKCGLNEQTLRRIMRYAMTNRIFKERDGLVTHTAASKLLNENPLMHEWIGMICEESWPAAARAAEALDRWPASEEPEHTGFAIAKNTDIPFFKDLSNDPKRAKRFADAMSMFESSHGSAITSLLDNYPWSAIGEGTVVDVGGSHGSRAKAIAEKFLSLHCVVLDLPEVVVDGPSNVPKHLQSRVTFLGHDFFTEPPMIAKGADVYLFCRVFHNWSDKYSMKILRNLRPALKPGARILISDMCLAEPGVLPCTVEQKMRASDLGMLAMLNARERGSDDWARLFREADEQFQFLGVRKIQGSQMAFIEANWLGSEIAKGSSVDGIHPSPSA